MGKTADSWTIEGSCTVDDNLEVGTGNAGYLATYNWFAVDGDGFKCHALKFWDFGTSAYRKVYLRSGTFEAQ